MLSAFVDAYERWILQRPILSIALCLLVIAGLASQLGRLVVDASADSLMLEGDTDLEYFRQNSERYSAEEFLVVTR